MVTSSDIESRKATSVPHGSPDGGTNAETKRFRKKLRCWTTEENNADDQNERKYSFDTTRLLGLILILLIALLLIVTTYKIHMSLQESKGTCKRYCLTETCIATASSMLSNMDTSVDPCQDFYEFACGRWSEKYTIPPDRSHYDTFSVMKDKLTNTLRGLLESPVDETDSIATINVKNMYTSCMNETLIELRGAKPLIQLLNSLGGWPVLGNLPPGVHSAQDWVLLMAKLRLFNNDILISQGVGFDNKNSSVYVIQVDQAQVGMSSKEYYQEGSPQRNGYFKLMLTTATLLGAKEEAAKEELSEVLQFERNISDLIVPSEERRNFSAMYNRMTLKELKEAVPGINWTLYFNITLPVPIDDDEPIVVYALDYLKRVSELIEVTSAKTLRNYLLWRFVYNRISNLDNRFTKAKQEYLKIMHGTQSMAPRWETCVAYTNKNLGMAVGALFVRTHFDHNGKKKIEDMILNIKEAFYDVLKKVDWMDDETKEVAWKKAEGMGYKIGFPEYILNATELDADYKELTLLNDTYFENVIEILKQNALKDQLRLRSTVDKTQWVTPPAEVNAFYTRPKNFISLPVGLLQPPFYHPDSPQSVNYGGVGVVIGHEITHAFDDKGRQFDHNGNLKQWWSPAALEKFQMKADCMVKQYARYEMADVNLTLNGVNTQGENIADNGGIKQSFKSFLKWEMKHGSEGLLPGLNLTHRQLFFLNYAQIWCGAMRPEAAFHIIKTGTHPPGKFRVIGTLSNFPEFSSTFDCSLNTPMNPEEKCSVW